VYYVYILTNHRRSVFYTGITNDLSRRVAEHYLNRGERKSFTGRYSCYNLLYFEEFENITSAIEREKEIKKWRREKKLWLIAKTNPGFVFLNATLF
jgi:putative endonuclease